jgi:hypothetical protein
MGESSQCRLPQGRKLAVTSSSMEKAQVMSSSKEKALTDVILKRNGETVLGEIILNLRKLISLSEKALSESIFSRERASNDVLDMEESSQRLRTRKPFKGYLLPTNIVC